VIRRFICVAAILALAACEKKTEKKAQGMTAEEVAAQLASVKVDPGQWESTTEIVSAKGPLPQAALQEMIGQRTNVSNCITPEQAKRPSANFLAAQQNSECTYQDFRLDGGRLTGTMTCTGGDVPGETVTKMNGHYGPQDYDIAMDIETNPLPGAGPMQIRARAQGKRTGDCA